MADFIVFKREILDMLHKLNIFPDLVKVLAQLLSEGRDWLFVAKYRGCIWLR